MSISRKIAATVSIAVIAATVVYWYNQDGAWARLINLSELPRFHDNAREVFTPPPLRGDTGAHASQLTDAGILYWSNSHRADAGLFTLERNTQLDNAARLKIRDMFENQYFEHTSPEGKGVSDLAVSVGYNYIFLGENLALGNYRNDEVLVQAWMDSPGHRENILNQTFREIGIAVERGRFENKNIWLAVQIFALPQTYCPIVNESLKQNIETEELRVFHWKEELKKLKDELDDTPRRSAEYNRLVDEYNELASRVNNLIYEIKLMVDDYNRQINALNECLKRLR